MTLLQKLGVTRDLFSLERSPQNGLSQGLTLFSAKISLGENTLFNPRQPLTLFRSFDRPPAYKFTLQNRLPSMVKARWKGRFRAGRRRTTRAHGWAPDFDERTLI